MMLVYSGISRISSEAQENSLKIDPTKRNNSLVNIARISDKVTEGILKENIHFDIFSDYLEETWENKIKLFPDCENTRRILKIYSEAKKFGARSGKLLGAGGGGFFLFLVEENLQDEFKKKMNNYTVVKHNICNSPCTVLFNSMSNQSK